MLEGEMTMSLDQFAGGTGDAADGAAGAADEPEAPGLPEMDDETRAGVEAYYAAQEQARRSQMQQYGLDVAPDGQPVIRDPQAFARWAGPAPESRRQPEPTAVAAPAAAAPVDDDAPVEFDPLELTGAKLQEIIRREAARLVAPVQQENQRLMTEIQRRSANDALASVRDSLAAAGWSEETVQAVDHPDFAAAYRQLAAGVDPARLEDPRMKQTLALQIIPWLEPARERQPASVPPSTPRDTQGRFIPQAEVARGMVSRQSAGQVAPARGGMAPPPPRDAESRQMGEFIQAFQSQDPRTARFKAPSAADLEALEEVDFDSFQKARTARR